MILPLKLFTIFTSSTAMVFLRYMHFCIIHILDHYFITYFYLRIFLYMNLQVSFSNQDTVR